MAEWWKQASKWPTTSRNDGEIVKGGIVENDKNAKKETLFFHSPFLSCTLISAFIVDSVFLHL